MCPWDDMVVMSFCSDHLAELSILRVFKYQIFRRISLGGLGERWKFSSGPLRLSELDCVHVWDDFTSFCLALVVSAAMFAFLDSTFPPLDLPLL